MYIANKTGLIIALGAMIMSVTSSESGQILENVKSELQYDVLVSPDKTLHSPKDEVDYINLSQVENTVENSEELLNTGDIVATL